MLARGQTSAGRRRRLAAGAVLLLALFAMLLGFGPAFAQSRSTAVAQPAPDFRSDRLGRVAQPPPGETPHTSDGPPSAPTVPTAPTLTMPQLVGLPQDEAVRTLRIRELSSPAIRIVSSDAPEGRVVQQSPRAGRAIDYRTPILLGVSDGSLVRVPNILGLTPSEAAVRLERAELALGSGTSERSRRPLGTIIRSEPGYAQAVRRGSRVNYTVAEEPLPTVPMPNVVGMIRSEAEQRISGQGLRQPGSRTRRSDQPRDVVIDQSPKAGRQVDVETPISLTLSDGRLAPPTQVMPNVVGLNSNAAQARLLAMGLQTPGVSSAASERDRDIVIAQAPAAGQAVTPRTPLQLTVSDGSVRVPALAGLTPDEARRTLEAVQLRLGAQSTQPASGTPAGRIFSANPTAGSLVPKGSAVNVAVAVAATIRVPGVVGLTQAEASRKLRAARFEPAKAPARPGAKQIDRVAGQRPAAGAEAPIGSSVVMALAEQAAPPPPTPPPTATGTDAAAVVTTPPVTPPSSPTAAPPPPDRPPATPGPPPDLTVPDVVNRTEATAIRDLQAVGYRTNVAPTRLGYWRADRVARQSPEAGEPAQRGATVQLYMTETIVPTLAGGAAAVLAALAGLGWVLAWPLRVSVVPALEGELQRSAQEDGPAEGMEVRLIWALAPAVDVVPDEAETWADPVDHALEIRVTWEVAVDRFEATEDPQPEARVIKEGSDA